MQLHAEHGHLTQSIPQQRLITQLMGGYMAVSQQLSFQCHTTNQKKLKSDQLSYICHYQNLFVARKNFKVQKTRYRL